MCIFTVHLFSKLNIVDQATLLMVFLDSGSGIEKGQEDVVGSLVVREKRLRHDSVDPIYLGRWLYL